MSKEKKNKKVIEIESQEEPETTGTEDATDPKPTETPEEITPEQQIEELTQKLQRMGADYHNYQKRSIRQIDEAARMAKENFARSLLPVLDNFEHTLNADHSNQDTDALLKGVRIVYDSMMNMLTGHSVEMIRVKPGEPFDPNQHEAMLKQESEEFEENAVIAEFAPGYKMNDRTLRPTKVSVAKAPLPAVATEENGQDEAEEV